MRESKTVPKLPFAEVEVKPEYASAVTPNGVVARTICGAGMHMPSYLSKLLKNVSKETVSRVIVVGNNLVAGVFDNGNIVGWTEIMPNIVDVNVINKNDMPKVVIVTFADGTKEKAVLDEKDTYSLEQGISICITKKLLGKNTAYGSSLYNKVIKHAMNVMASNEKDRNEAKLAEKAAKEKAVKAHEKERKRKAKKAAAKREYDISVQKEAYIRAMKQLQEENRVEMEESLNGIASIFDEIIKKCEEEDEANDVTKSVETEKNGENQIHTITDAILSQSEMNESHN